jgi:hypothetical protein
MYYIYFGSYSSIIAQFLDTVTSNQACIYAQYAQTEPAHTQPNLKALECSRLLGFSSQVQKPL